MSTTHDAGVELVDWDDPEAARMRADQQLEMARLYAPEELVGDLGPDGQPWTSDVAAPLDPATVVATVVVRVDGVAVGCGSVRDISGTDDGVGGRHAAAVGEVKRVYVEPAHRGRGYSRLIMVALEEHAQRAGLRRLILETGLLQPEAIGLYLALGYEPIDRYGEYAQESDSRCFGKTLHGPLEIREVPWSDPDARVLRREMHELENAPRYPRMVTDVEAAGGFDVVDARLGESILVAFVAYRDGEALGFASFRRADPPADAADLKKVYVRAAGRRTGAARALVQACEDAARERGLPLMLLETGIRQPAAITLYRSMGYRPVQPFAPYGKSEFGLFFGRRL